MKQNKTDADSGASRSDAGLGTGHFEIVAYRREWDGDDSDLGCYVYADAGEELDNSCAWEPLYALVPNV